MGGDHDGDQVLLIWDQEMPGFRVFLCVEPQLPSAPVSRKPGFLLGGYYAVWVTQ